MEAVSRDNSDISEVPDDTPGDEEGDNCHDNINSDFLLVCLDGRCTWSVLVIVSWVRLTPALSELPYRDPDILRSCSLFPDNNSFSLSLELSFTTQNLTIEEEIKRDFRRVNTSFAFQLTSPAGDDIMQQTALAHAANQEEYGETQGGHLVKSQNKDLLNLRS